MTCPQPACAGSRSARRWAGGPAPSHGEPRHREQPQDTGQPGQNPPLAPPQPPPGPQQHARERRQHRRPPPLPELTPRLRPEHQPGHPAQVPEHLRNHGPPPPAGLAPLPFQAEDGLPLLGPDHPPRPTAPPAGPAPPPSTSRVVRSRVAPSPARGQSERTRYDPRQDEPMSDDEHTARVQAWSTTTSRPGTRTTPTRSAPCSPRTPPTTPSLTASRGAGGTRSSGSGCTARTSRARRGSAGIRSPSARSSRSCRGPPSTATHPAPTATCGSSASPPTAAAPSSPSGGCSTPRMPPGGVRVLVGPPVFKLCFRSSAPFVGVYSLGALGVAARRRPGRSARVAVAVAVAAAVGLLAGSGPGRGRLRYGSPRPWSGSAGPAPQGRRPGDDRAVGAPWHGGPRSKQVCPLVGFLLVGDTRAEYASCRVAPMPVFTAEEMVTMRRTALVLLFFLLMATTATISPALAQPTGANPGDVA